MIHKKYMLGLLVASYVVQVMESADGMLQRLRKSVSGYATPTTIAAFEQQLTQGSLMKDGLTVPAPVSVTRKDSLTAEPNSGLELKQPKDYALDDVMVPAPGAVGTGNLTSPITDGFVQGARDICMPYALKFLNLGSNNEIMKRFAQTVLNREAGYSAAERAYLLGYFKSCILSLKDAQSQGVTQGLQRIIEVVSLLGSASDASIHG